MPIVELDGSIDHLTETEVHLPVYGQFPAVVYVIHAGADKFVCADQTIDGSTVVALLCWGTEHEAGKRRGTDLVGVDALVVAVTFDEARDIAKSKPDVAAIALERNNVTVDICFVR